MRKNILDGHRFILAICLLLVGFMQAGNEGITIYMIGDSTMSNKPLDDNPERGWGQLLPQFFDSTVRIENHAKNGRSTKSFLAETLWQPVFEKLRPGDYVIIQFGHNDEKKDKPDRYASPEEYGKNLLRYVTETRSKNAIPILCTPIVRRRFDKDGIFNDDHGAYPDVVRDIALQNNVPLLDMHKKTVDLLEELGPEKSKQVYLWVDSAYYKSLPNGKQDNTHFSEYGATVMARLAIDELQRLHLPLAEKINNEAVKNYDSEHEKK